MHNGQSILIVSIIICMCKSIRKQWADHYEFKHLIFCRTGELVTQDVPAYRQTGENGALGVIVVVIKVYLNFEFYINTAVKIEF